MNPVLVCAFLNTLCLLALAFLIQRIRVRDAADLLATQQQASARLAQATQELTSQLKEQADRANLATPGERMSIQSLSLALLAQATSMGVQTWQAIIPAFVAVQDALDKRRHYHQIEATDEADRQEAEARAQAFTTLLARAGAESQVMDHCATTEEALSIQAKVRWIISLWGVPTESEFHALDLVGRTCDQRYLTRTQTLRDEARKLHDEQFGGALKKLRPAGGYADIADLHLNHWRQNPSSTSLFGAYLSAVAAAIKALSPEEATRILVEAEGHLRTFKTAVHLEDFNRALEFKTNLQDAKLNLQGRIRNQRQAAFSEVLASLPRLSKQSQTTKSRGKLSAIKQDADRLVTDWGPMNTAERTAWEAEYGPFMKELLDRDETLVNAEKAAELNAAANGAIQATDELSVALTKASHAVDQAKEAKEIERVLREIGKLVQPNPDALPIAKRETLEAKTQLFQTAIQAAEHRIVGEMRAAYNQNSVKEIDNMLGRLVQPDNLKTSKTNTLVGGFANIDPTLLEPAIHQYYELAVGKVVNLLDDEATRSFMDYLAQSPKSGMETHHA